MEAENTVTANVARRASSQQVAIIRAQERSLTSKITQSSYQACGAASAAAAATEIAVNKRISFMCTSWRDELVLHLGTQWVKVRPATVLVTQTGAGSGPMLFPNPQFYRSGSAHAAQAPHFR